MSEHTEEHHAAAAIPPVGEEIHMPAPSILPLLNSAALAAMIVCVTLSWWLVATFGLVFLITTIRWVADVRRDIAELPLDHSHH
jgi:type IV secretory pathway TrbD component